MPNGQHFPILRPVIDRGDYFRSKQEPIRSRCRAYLTPPSVPGRVRAWPDEQIEHGTYLGPVHKCEHTLGFASILVPHPYHREKLVWINVWGAFPKPVDFAQKVDDHMLQRWRAMGWQDEYVDFNPREHGDEMQYVLFESFRLTRVPEEGVA